MEDVDVKVTLENHSIRLDNAEKQIEQLSHISASIQDLTLSVNELAISMKHMLAEQRDQGDRIKVLEEVPAKSWSTATRTILTTVVSTLAGAVAVGLILLAASQF